MKALVGIDFSRSSLAAADWVARWFLPEDRVALAYCIQVPPTPSFYRVHDDLHDTIVQHAQGEARKSLDPLLQEFGRERTEAHVETGPPADTLPRVAKDVEADILAVGPHGHTPPLQGFFGSTASRLIRFSEMPVLVVEQAKPRVPKRVLIAMDDGALTPRVSEVGVAMARRHGSDVLGLYVFEEILAGLPVLRGPTGDLDLGAGIADTAEYWIKELLEDTGAPRERIQARAVQGHVGTAICDAAKEDVDLIVMGTHGKALAGQSIGSVARYVVGHAPCPVLVVPQSA